MDDGSDAFDAIDSSYSDGDYSDEDYSDEKTSDNGDKPYITVRGSKKTRININVGEMNLDKFQEGAVVQGMSYDTSESFSAKVLSIDPEPVPTPLTTTPITPTAVHTACSPRCRRTTLLSARITISR